MRKKNAKQNDNTKNNDKQDDSGITKCKLLIVPPYSLWQQDLSKETVCATGGGFADGRKEPSQSAR